MKFSKPVYRVKLRKLGEHKWEVWVRAINDTEGNFNEVPVLNYLGKPHIDGVALRIKDARPLPKQILQRFVFSKKEDAEGLGWQLGKYALGLGDFVDSWMSVE